MKKYYFTLIFLGLGLLYSCSSAKVISDIEQGTDFTQYQTYTWSTIAEPINKDFPQFDNSLNRERWRKAIDAAMQNRMYALVEGEADLQVDFHLQFEHNIVPYQYHEDDIENPFASPRPGAVYQYDRGTVIIHLVDLKKNRVVWQGVSTRILDVELLDNADANIQEAVNGIFKKLAAQLDQ